MSINEILNLSLFKYNILILLRIQGGNDDKNLNIAKYLEFLTIFFFHLIENGARRKAEIKNFNLYE